MQLFAVKNCQTYHWNQIYEGVDKKYLEQRFLVYFKIYLP